MIWQKVLWKRQKPVRETKGGVPVYRNGQRIGAISTSGARAAQDEEFSVASAEVIVSVSSL